MGCSLLALLAVLLPLCAASIVGCGGFVRFPAGVSGEGRMEGVRVQLGRRGEGDAFTVMESVDVLPSGSYFAPLDHPAADSLWLRAVGPSSSSSSSAWRFDPPLRPARCEDANDLDFVFVGLPLRLQVGCAGCAASRGVANVSLRLGNSAVVTDALGWAALPSVLPGTHEVLFARGQWTLRSSLRLDWDGSHVFDPKPVVPGFRVAGKAVAGGGPCPGVVVSLEGRKLAVTDADGVWQVDELPSGDFELVPSMRKDGAVWHVEPPVLKLHVDAEDVDLGVTFRVTRFSVTGRVVSGEKQLQGVDVRVVRVDKNEDAQTAVSNADGSFAFLAEEGARYTLSASKAGYYFDPVTLNKLEASRTTPPTISASAFDVCVVLDVDPTSRVSISLEPTDGSSATTPIRSTGNCFKAARGTYVVKGSIGSDSASKQSADSFNPVRVTVTDAPILENVVLRQSRGSVQGRITCIDAASCGGVKASLASFADTTQVVTAAAATDGSFSFANVAPGRYALSVEHSGWCWQKEQEDVVVRDNEVTRASFLQTGFVVNVDSKYAGLTVTAEANGAVVAKWENLRAGANNVCVSQSGKLTLRPEAPCQRFEPQSVDIDTRSGNAAAQFAPSSFKISGKIDCSQDCLAAVDVLVNKQPLPKGSVSVTSGQWEAYVKAGEAFVVRPVHPSLQFYPEQQSGVMGTGAACQPALATFAARAGKFVTGRTEPATAGVKVTLPVTTDAGNDGSHSEGPTAVTAADGTYRLGPLRDDVRYGSLTASLDGFSVQPSASNPDVLLVAPLSDIIVTVYERLEGGQGTRPLPECVLSLSGNNYRDNQLTATNGSYAFRGLHPSQNYYVRPLLKEYVFDPTQATVALTTAPASLTFHAVRVSYSAFGTVVGLNKEPEKSVGVQAWGSDSSLTETRTDDRGTFRLRGLAPGVSYKIQVNEERLERASPAQFDIVMGKEDVRDLVFVAFRSLQKYDVAGYVRVPSEGVEDAVWPALQISLVQSGNVLATSNGSFFFEFRDVAKGAYSLLVTAELSDRSHVFSPVELQLDLTTEETTNATLEAISATKKGSRGFLANPRRVFLDVNFSVHAVVHQEAQEVLENHPYAGLFVFFIVCFGIYFRQAWLEAVFVFIDTRDFKQAKRAFTDSVSATLASSDIGGSGRGKKSAGGGGNTSSDAKSASFLEGTLVNVNKRKK